jgi:hypothetical protein
MSPPLHAAANYPSDSTTSPSFGPEGSESGVVNLKLETELGNSQGEAREQAKYGTMPIRVESQ